jgi:hypothetical protein
MFRSFIVVPLIFAASAFAQTAAQPNSSASCTLDDGSQIFVRYNKVSAKSERPANGKPWAPGGAAMTLFTEKQLSLNGATIPVGAYTLFPIPGGKWTLVVNRNVAAGAPYDEKQDLARAPMEMTALTETVPELDLALAHVGSKCGLRIYFGKIAAVAEFTEKP